MSKKNKNIPKHAAPASEPTKKETIIPSSTLSTEFPPNDTSFWSKLTEGKLPYIIISVLGLVLYANTFNHEFALDDDLIVCGNTYVLRGIDGIGDIMKNDIFDSYNKSINAEANLSGGRFRPFSLATFAIEQEFIGTMPDGIKEDSWDVNKNKVGDPSEDLNHDGVYNDKDPKTKGAMLRHVNNVLLYILSICILYLFLSRFFFKDNKLLALLTALLFLAHPLHTEVVANVKSRDEILSLMFMVLTLHLSFLYVETRNMKNLIWAFVCYFIALLSKEYGATLLIILPVSLYAYYYKFKFSDVPLLLIGLVLTFGIYWAMRSSVVVSLGENAKQDSELLNNPFMNATTVQAIATKIYINLKYFLLMIIPIKLSCDYSFNVIPFRTFANPEVWVSLIVLIGLSVGTLWALKKRNWLVIPLLFILTHLFLINNFLFNIGATMGERLVYHSSFGVCILLVYGLYYLFAKILKVNPQYISFALLPIIALYNNITLYTTDVKSYPSSTMLNGNTCISLFDLSNLPGNKSREKGLLDSANMYGLKALQLHPGYFYTHMNLGLVKARQGDMDSATYHWMKAKELSPYEKKIPEFLDGAAANYYNKGVGFLNENNFDEALKNLMMANKIKPNDHRPYYYLGLTYQKMKNFSKAKEMFSKGLAIVPNDATMQNALREVANY
jgi:hypothetical protein